MEFAKTPSTITVQKRQPSAIPISQTPPLSQGPEKNGKSAIDSRQAIPVATLPNHAVRQLAFCAPFIEHPTAILAKPQVIAQINGNIYNPQFQSSQLVYS